MGVYRGMVSEEGVMIPWGGENPLAIQDMPQKLTWILFEPEFFGNIKLTFYWREETEVICGRDKMTIISWFSYKIENNFRLWLFIVISSKTQVHGTQYKLESIANFPDHRRHFPFGALYRPHARSYAHSLVAQAKKLNHSPQNPDVLAPAKNKNVVKKEEELERKKWSTCEWNWQKKVRLECYNTKGE